MRALVGELCVGEFLQTCLAAQNIRLGVRDARALRDDLLLALLLARVVQRIDQAERFRLADSDKLGGVVALATRVDGCAFGCISFPK